MADNTLLCNNLNTNPSIKIGITGEKTLFRKNIATSISTKKEKDHPLLAQYSI